MVICADENSVLGMGKVCMFAFVCAQQQDKMTTEYRMAYFRDNVYLLQRGQ